MELTAEHVNELARKVLFRDDETPDGKIPGDAVLVDGIVCNYAFNRQRLYEEKANIASMLDDLSDDFKTTGGGGMSFLNACVTKDGEQWTGVHATMAMLFALGIGVGLCSYTLPRDMWSILPGSVPYITIDSNALASA